jgi:hypothetical protein
MLKVTFVIFWCVNKTAWSGISVEFSFFNSFEVTRYALSKLQKKNLFDLFNAFDYIWRSLIHIRNCLLSHHDFVTNEHYFFFKLVLCFINNNIFLRIESFTDGRNQISYTNIKDWLLWANLSQVCCSVENYLSKNNLNIKCTKWIVPSKSRTI